MSDKSFGDHTGRGVVKNPLLSTAVTGLSIEDLTHNAVLLPVSRTQELFGRQAVETTPVHETTPAPSGDATNPPNPPPNPPQQNAKKEKDDFNVNEYYARLHGSRYVSAPINSHLNEENTDLEAKEENLEEINLNEPIAANEDVQQSLTADIAQNFSQLPTVLPQVASAVFSSFSNMLNMKSREHTPEERCREPQVQEVPLMGVSEREVAPPPREPPVTRPGNYRLATKKKYAQIPGLSLGESSQMPTYAPPTFNQPIFTPPQLEAKDIITDITNMTIDSVQSNVDSKVSDNILQNIPVETSNNRTIVFEAQDNSNVVATSQYTQDSGPQAAIIPPPPMFSNLAKKDSQSNVDRAILPPSVARRIGSNKPAIAHQAPAFATFGNIFVPAPVTAHTQSSMSTAHSFVSAAQTTPSDTSFAPNSSQEPSQSGVPMDVSSPNVALNLTLDKPPDTQFVPKPSSQATMDVSPLNLTLDKPPVAQFAPKPTSQGSSISIPTSIPSSAVHFNTEVPRSVPSPPRNVFGPPPSSHPVSASMLTRPQTFTFGPPSISATPTFIPGIRPQLAQNIPPRAHMHPYANVRTPASRINTATSAGPQIFDPYPQAQPTPGFKSDDSTLTSQPQPTRDPMINQLNQHESVLSSGISNTVPMEETPKLPEPPKATGPTNYRMTKKRPRYYAGPIEGVGAISNNVIPTLPPVTTAFQGAIFTPEASTSHQPAVFTPENIPSSSQSATITPTAGNSNQSSMFTPLGINVDASNQNAFDINKPVDNAGLNNPSENVYGSYKTAFDMSHQATNNEPPKQEKGFGIIDSFKTKLSSIDINKLQNSVTTFFDPAYNATKAESVTENESTHGQDQGIEICVGNPETPAQPYNYDAHQASFTYGQGAIPNATDYYNQQIHNVYSNNSYYSEPSYGTQSYSRTELPAPVDGSSVQISGVSTYPPNITHNVQDNVEINTNDNNNIVRQESSESSSSSEYEFTNTNRRQYNTEERMKQLLDNLASIRCTDEHGEPIMTMMNDPRAYISSDKVDENGYLIVERSNPSDRTMDSNFHYHQVLLNNMPPLMIPDSSRETCDGVSEKGDDRSWNTNEEEVDNQSVADRLLTLGDSSEDSQHLCENGHGADLNICETCREVNQPEPKDDDLTTKLIENVTAPVQLLNPVEVPLTETNSSVPTVVDNFDTINQCAEISLIAGETVETLQIQSATELLDANKSPSAETCYGWRTEAPLPLGHDLLDHDYTFKINPDSIGFFDNDNVLVDNITDVTYVDDTEVELKVPHDDPSVVLLRQMSIPTAPPTVPHSDDTKSDETGALDVQSIEQDANKDFPVFEEFVIEPSETDDDKMEFKDSHDENKDTFTNRVDRFKKLEGNDSSEQKDSGSSNISMPSYFDTGNYAAEAHFKNPRSSPTISRIPPGFEDHYELRPDKKYEVVTVPDTSTQTKHTTTVSDARTNAENVTSIVFSNMATGQASLEEELPNSGNVFEAKLPRSFGDHSEQLPDNIYDIVKVPDTSTQLKHTTTVSEACTKAENVTSTVFSNMATAQAPLEELLSSASVFETKGPPSFGDHYEQLPDEKYEVVKVPDTSTQTKPTTTVSEARTSAGNVTSTVFSNMATAQVPPQELPDCRSVFGDKIDHKDTSIPGTEEIMEMPANDETSFTPQVKEEDKVQERRLESLPDPINFFASSSQTDDVEMKTDDTEGVNRLASYFMSPPNQTRSFFESGQGQNHDRQNNDKIEGAKPFFQLSQSQDHYKENVSNIPTDRFIANLTLMNDLTSCQNIDPSKEQIVRTVNYFTVEYDSGINFYYVPNFNKGEPGVELKQSDLNIKSQTETEESIINNVGNLTEVVNKCKYCCDSSILTVRGVDFDSIGKVQFRQAMDTGNKPSQGGIMQRGREEERSVGIRVDDFAEDGDNREEVAIMTENRSSNEYEPVKHHWFYRVDSEDKSTWRGFSVSDSRAIENAFLSPELNEGTLVPTDGGRYDVNVMGRLRTSVYWSDKPTNVRRCSWFYKGTTDARYVPYTEAVAEKLEVEYRHGMTTGEWHRRLVLPNNELVVMHGPAVMVHFLQAGADAFSAPNLLTFGKRVYRNPPKLNVCRDLPPKIDHLLFLVHGAGEWRHQRDKIQSTMRPRVVRRGIDDSEIEDTEPSSIDHLLLLCHGVGSACDMRFRAVEEVVDDFRATSLQLLQSHYRNSYDSGIVGRVEVLPISWHAPLHTGPNGVDRRLARVTLASIPRLRNFTNDTVLDVLLYTSPHYCQMILDTVCGELNRIYTLFMKRNPDFKGQVSLGGHSLGSVILYDLLCHQPIPRCPSTPRSEKTYLSGSAANNPSFQYPRLCFEPLALYALGSPIAIFECIRGVESLGSEFRLPTCKNFFNIFHPYDPIAYRIEPLVNPQLENVKPHLIPHHKGRKRMHLELKDTMARVGADLKQKLVESIRSTWSSMWASAAPPDHQLEKVVEEEIEKEQLEAQNAKEDPILTDITPGEMLGRLNGGRRVDYVLQEAPFEMINEYLFAMSSHVCYWESEDVMLLILREIYDSMGVQPDVTVPQQSMSVQRVTVVRDGETVVVNSSDASTSRVT